MDLLALHEFVVKVSVFLEAVGSSAQLEPEDAELFSKYAEKLAEQGLFVTAAKYCKGDSLDSKILRDRLYRSKASPKCLAAMGNTPPEFPFSLADVKKARVQKAAQQAQQVSQQNNGRQESYQSSASTNSYSQQQGYAQASQQTAPNSAPQQVSDIIIERLFIHKFGFVGI